MGMRSIGAALVAAAAVLGFAAPAALATAPPVTNTNDAGTGSLRASLLGAASGDTVNVPAGIYTLTGGPLMALVDVHIVGTAGAGSTTITTSGAQRLLVSFTALSVSGITFSGGRYSSALPNDGGGAIVDSTADVTISGCAFNNNSTNSTSPAGFGGGGAIYVNGNLTVSNSTFSGNSATANTGSNNGGGAIFISGGGKQLTLNGDAFNGDSFTESGAADYDGGGAVYAANVATRMSGSFISGAHSTTNAALGARFNGGGAIWSGNGLALIGSSLSGDTATVNNGGMNNGGGAVFNNMGALSITGSTVAGNTAALALQGILSNGGGGLYDLAGAITISNSTISGNSVSATGGPNTAAGGGLYDAGSGGGTISSTTIAGNSVSFPGPGNHAEGGGLYETGSVGGTLALSDTIVAANNAASGTGCRVAGTTTISSQGHNIEDGNTCAFAAGGDQPNTNPQLGALASNGGPTGTEALLGGSPAIDHGAGCPATDQRGVARPVGPACDVGAYEFAPPVSAASAPACGGVANITLTVPPGTSALAIMDRLDGGTAQSAAGASATIAVPQGVHQLEYWGVDAGGDAEQSHHNISVLSDLIAPTVLISSEQNTSTYRLGQPASVAVTASGAASGFASNPSAIHVGLPTNTRGPHAISRVATSNCGLQGSATFRYNVIGAGSPTRPRLPTRLPTTLFDRTFGLPSTKRCFSGRVFTVRIHAPAGSRIKRVKFTLAGHSTTVSGRKHRLVLRGLPKGAFTLKIDATTTAGKHIKGTRRYHTCKSKKKR